VVVYVDTSVLLRVVLGERGRLRAWARIVKPASSELIRVECLRTLDRARLAGLLEDDEVAEKRQAVEDLLASFDLVTLDRRVLRRAAEPLPTTLGTLDALHLASAMALRTRIPELRLATHDQTLAVAARAVGFTLVA
jgi:predicted nucleic acid-binding protein